MSKNYVVVTGATSGIGAAITRLLADNGYRVIGCARSADSSSNDTQGVHYQRCDISDPASIEQLVQFVESLVDSEPPAQFALINNAAYSGACPLEGVSKTEFDKTMATNAYGPLALIQGFLPLMKRVPSRIINISSGAGVLSVPLNGVYSMSKFALEAMSDALRIELKQFGIKTVVVQPGLIDTNIHDTTLASLDLIPPQVRQTYADQLDKSVVQQGKAARGATPPEKVAEVIYKAITHPNPAARYGAGADARLLRRIHWLLHDRIRDAMLSKRGGW